MKEKREKKVEAAKSQYLTFQSHGEEFAVAVLRVREIIEYGTVTRVPSTPAYIRGVINLRGTVVPVFDLAAKFGGAVSEITRRSCIVILEVVLDGEETLVGILADAVDQVVDLGADDIEPPPPFGTRVRVEFLTGMGKLGQGFVLILDTDRLLSSNEILAGEAAAAAAPTET
jgi:purine-binding chemotaxis protein CheW